jgi:hypothetical protein
MNSTAAKVQELDYFTHLNKEFQSDLYWWHTFLGLWNGVSFLQPKNTPDVATQTLLVLGAAQLIATVAGYSGSGQLIGLANLFWQKNWYLLF